MPGPFINNDGYEPASWDEPKKPAKPTEPTKAEMLAAESQANIERMDKLSIASTNEMLKLTEWKPDCQGKMDFDIDLLQLSTRYYPDNTAYATLYLQAEGAGIELAKFFSEPGNHMGAPDARVEIVEMARAQIQKYVYALLRVTDPAIIQKAVEKAGL